MSNTELQVGRLPDLFVKVDMNEIGPLLIKSNDIHEGFFNLVVEFEFGAGRFGPEGNRTPGVITRIKTIGLERTDAPTDLSLDASKINPSPRASAKSAGAKRPGAKKAS